MSISVRLRPSVDLPEWSVVSSDTARRALDAILGAIGVAEKWSGVTATQDRVWRTLIQLYLRLGRAPSAGEIAATAGLSSRVVRGELEALRSRDLVVLDGGHIVGAYPFSERRTGHTVHVNRKALTAMCAIDALGIGAMVGADTRVESSCRHCGIGIAVETRDQGMALASHSPGGVVVWAGIRHDGCSATSLCTVLAFFCSDAHLAAWRDGPGREGTGFRLTLEEGFEVGKAIFRPILRPAVPA